MFLALTMIYLKRQRELTAQLTNNEGSLASLLTQARADILVIACPSHTDTRRVRISLPCARSVVNDESAPLSSPTHSTRPLGSKARDRG